MIIYIGDIFDNYMFASPHARIHSNNKNKLNQNGLSLVRLLSQIRGEFAEIIETEATHATLIVG